MANKRTAKEYVIDRILQEILTDAQNNEGSYWFNNHWQLDLDKIRKTVTDNGFVTTGTNVYGKNIVLTREDWQEINENFNIFVDNVVSCYKEYDNRDGYVIPTTVDESNNVIIPCW